jgi:hypothetical protein
VAVGSVKRCDCDVRSACDFCAESEEEDEETKVTKHPRISFAATRVEKERGVVLHGLDPIRMWVKSRLLGWHTRPEYTRGFRLSALSPASRGTL